MSMYKKNKLVFSLLGASLALPPLHLTAATGGKGLDEVIVTAQKREVSDFEASFSAVTLSGDDLETFDISSLDEVSGRVPGVELSLGASQPVLYVRGVGSGLNPGFEQAVAIYSGDVYLARGEFLRAPLAFDVERVQFIAGAQGSSMGKNALAGSVNLLPRAPGGEGRGYLGLSYAPEDSELRLRGAVQGELAETVSARLAVQAHTMDGWWDNNETGDEGPDLDNLYARGTLDWHGQEWFARLRYEYGDLDMENGPFVVYQSGAGINFQGREPFPVISDGEEGAGDLPNTGDTDIHIAVLHLERNMDTWSFTSVSAYAGYDTSRIESADFSPEAALHRSKDEEFSQWSQEFRFQSIGDGSLNWTLGLYTHFQDLEAQRRSLDTDFLLLGDLSVPAIIEQGDAFTASDFQQDTSTASAYALVEQYFGEAFSVSAGLRYTYEEKDASERQLSSGSQARYVTDDVYQPETLVYTDANGVLIDDLRTHDFGELALDEDDLSWSLVGNWFADSLHLYASVNTAFKSGGFDEAYGGPGPTMRLGNPITGEPSGEVVATGVTEDTVTYDSEKAISYELGAKWVAPSGEASASAALFYSQYDDLQTSALDVDQFVVVNAGEATTQGIELSGRWMATPSLVFSAFGQYLDASWDDFGNAPCTVRQTVDPADNPGCLDANGEQIEVSSEAVGQDLSGETLLFAPEFSATVSATHFGTVSDSLDYLARLVVIYQDDYYSSLDLDENTRHDATTTLDAVLGIAPVDGNWRAAVIVRNLTDEAATIVNGDVPTTASDSYFAIPKRQRSAIFQFTYMF